ncbi:TetR family transcriptional regulator [Flavobacterium lutivivi]|nr:TetR family transcriptional regulator [Flavobacterium lutivivi]
MQEITTNRQIEIIEAAGKLLMAKGVKGLTTKNLSIELGFSESALYRHFRNKEDIVVLLINYLESNIKERLQPIYENTNLTSSEKLLSIFNSQFTFFQQNPHFIIAILSEGLFNETDKINASILKVINYKLQLLSSIIDEGKKEGILKTALTTEEMVHIIIGSFRMMMLKWKFSGFQLDLITNGNSIMNTTINLLKS